MKTVRKLLVMLTAAALLCGILPLSAIGQGIQIERLTFLKVYIDEPVAGREADFYAGVVALPTDGARIFVEQKDNLHYRHGVGWYDHTDGRYLEEGECFTEGHEYTVYAAVMVNNYFYSLSSSLEATVNGKAATVTKGYTSKTVVSYRFGTCKNPPPDITQVTVGGNLRPVAGQAPVFTLAYDSERMEIDANAGTAFINGVAWYNSNTFVILDENDTFKAGEAYTMLVQFKSKGNYRFATHDGKSAVQGTVEGVAADNISDQEGDPSRCLKLQVEFTCVPADTLRGGREHIVLQIPYPVAGARPSYEPTVGSEGCERSAVNDNGFYNGVKWASRTHGVTCNEYSVFSEGDDYSVTVLVSASSVIADEMRLRTLLYEDGSMDPYVLATVNGLPARVEPYGDQSPSRLVQVTFDFPACHDTALTIDDITFTDIRTPVIGNTIDTQATVEFGYKETTLASRRSMTLTWYKLSEDSGELTAEDVFEEGCTYVFAVELSADAVSGFSVNGNEYNGNCNIRGAVQTLVQSHSVLPAEKGLLIGAVYLPLESLPDPLGRVDIIGAVAPTVGQRPYYDASLTEALMPYAEITDVEWLENGNAMAENTAFEKGNCYAVMYSVRAMEPYTFAQTAVIRGSVNGNETLYNGYDGSTGLSLIVSDDGQEASVMWIYGELFDASYTGVTEYVELGELMRPAPGQAPDFNVDISSPYTQFGGIDWYELDENGYRIRSLSYDDRFRSDTVYRAEIRVLPSAGRSINLDTRGAVLNGEFTQYYYLSGDAVVVYAEYDTNLCVTELDVIDVQYPLAGKTPDTDALSLGGNGEGSYLMSMVAYDNGSDIDWYYETNPDTAAAGFSRLDGRFKSDRRHQAYVQIETVDEAWFATDKDGKLAVDAYIDGIPVDFSYITDTYLYDGAVNQLEMARTYELAKNVGGVFVDGMWLTDGLYLDSAHWGVRTEQTVDKEAGYAYYSDGVLTLHDFVWECREDYDAVASSQPLTVHIEGDNSLTTNGMGISIGKPLTLTGGRTATLELTSDQYGIFVDDTLTVDGGNWYITNTTYDGIWLYDDLTMNDGYLYVCGGSSGIWGDDWPMLAVNGGTLVAESPSNEAIVWCDAALSEDAEVYVGEYEGKAAVLWDGVTSIDSYGYVSITVPTDAFGVLRGDVNGDGRIDLVDAVCLFKHVNTPVRLEGEGLLAADISRDGDVDLYDAARLFYYINGVTAEL